MIIRDLISLLLGIPAFWLVLRYNMHMFQLNTYMNNEQREWLRRNSHLQWILNFAVVLGIIRLAGRAFISVPWLGLAGDILIWFTFIVIILVYRLMVEMNSKKPLKFTPRVKRMVASDIALCVLLLVIPVAVIAAMMVSLQACGNSSGYLYSIARSLTSRVTVSGGAKTEDKNSIRMLLMGLIAGFACMIPYSAGVEYTQLISFEPQISIEGDEAVMRISDEDGNYTATLRCALGETRFSASPDGTYYYALINQVDHFTYLWYSDNGMLSSCEYRRQ